MRPTVPPQKIPDKLNADPDIARYLKELNSTVHKLWYQSNGNKNPILISTTEDIDVTSTNTTELYRVPTNKALIPLYIVIRVHGFTSGSKSIEAVVSFGSNSSTYDNYLNSVTYTVSGDNKFIFDKANDATELDVHTSNSSFNISIETASNADVEKWTVDLFGYLV